MYTMIQRNPPASAGGRMKQAVSVLLLVTLMTVSGIVAAEARREGGDDAMRKLQYLMRELTAENQSLKTENAKLHGELQDLKSENSKLTADIGDKKSALDRNRQHNEMLVERVRSDSDKYRTLVDRYREKQNELRMMQNKAGFLEQAVTERNQWIATCKANNDDLYKANSDLLDLYQNRGLLDVVAGMDKVTGLARVRKESMVEDYRYKLSDLRMFDFRDSQSQAPGETATASTQP
jgi:Skp family chaperone for outer membrane proteins